MDIKDVIKRGLLLATPPIIKRLVSQEYSKGGYLSYSMEGEDRVLNRLFGYRSEGTFVDVGAHHPIKHSNTYYYYKKGWRGINIDANPGSMALFNKYRPDDINIEMPVSDVEGVLSYYIFNEPDLNTFDESKIKEFLLFPGVKLENEIKLKMSRLDKILKENFDKLKSTKIDFFSIDVEGWDLHVLKSNDWNLFRPEFVLVEDLFSNIVETFNGELTKYMTSVGYDLVAKTHNTTFYKNR